MTHLTQSMMRVLEWRERRSRVALARLMRTVADTRARIEALDGVIAAVDARVKTSFEARLAGGPRTIAALTELEHHAKGLLLAREQVVDRRDQASFDLARLRAKQHVNIRQWRRDEAKLMHVKAMARRDVIARASREAESQDAAHCERVAAAERGR
jgi:hypothetical protein